MKAKKRLSMLRIPALALAFGVGAFAQAPLLITQPINNNVLVTLDGNTRPEENAQNDRGALAADTTIDHMLLQLQRSPQQEKALETLIDELHNPQSANYHKWLTAAQFGQQFGLAEQDLNTIRGWLQSQGFAVNGTYTSGMVIDFSGTAGQISKSFHTEIHNLLVDGVAHIANMSDPEIPAALAPAVVGVVSLNNFFPAPLYQERADYTTVLDGFTYYLLTPPDMSVIYTYVPDLRKHTDGLHQTVAVLERSDVKAQDWADFRTTFGMDRFKKGTFTLSHPPSPGTNNCADPGMTGDSVEATIDAEYSAATAPNAAIVVASCADTKTNFGPLLSMLNLLNAKPPAVMSLSYGGCEVLNPLSFKKAVNTLYQQGVTQGVTLFVSTGDDSAAGCVNGASYDTVGIGVNALASTAYNVAVGGTDFEDSYLGDNSTYWKATNNAMDESAISYVPEIPWNDSCASVLLASFEGYAATYGADGFCNSAEGSHFHSVAGGSGGPSACATGKPQGSSGVVSGTCAGTPKPSWQTGVVGIPADGVRDLPDVSMFAANGLWGHFYPVCYSAAASCAGAPSTWPGYGGTSFGAPIWAGIQAVINQNNGGAQGNANVVYYKIAAAQYGATGNASCNSSLGNQISRDCVFRDVTAGDMDVLCLTKHNCYTPSGYFGVLSTSSTENDPAYAAGVGYDLATGIGTPNVEALIKAWKTVAP
jgi:subtilase family serine protease